jgi:hypothetical protein
VVQVTSTSITNNASNTFSDIFTPGTYTWYVNCSDLAANYGNSSSRTFTVTAPTTTTTEGGGGGGGAPIVSGELVINPRSLNVPLILGETKFRKISLYNKGDADIDVSVAVADLADYLVISEKDSSFVLKPGETRYINVKVIAPGEVGVYTGKILINGEEVLVSLSVSTKKILFDVGITIPDAFKSIISGNKIKAQVNLIPMGEDPYLDVTLNYVVWDFDGKVYLTESETMLIDGQKSFVKDFSTQNLPAKDYVLGLEVLYPSTNPSDVAVSSSHFEILAEEKQPFPIYLFIILILAASILLMILLIILLMRRYKNTKRLLKVKRKK